KPHKNPPDWRSHCTACVENRINLTRLALNHTACAENRIIAHCARPPAQMKRGTFATYASHEWGGTKW
ncbi:hypothetical protein, partial [Paenibacillus sp. UNCCL117]|uniref:hypothetical protein n=1 Tax=Paenibacillus sp. UNCCL117 TaxID=1502764 RepID=UPI001C433F2C